MGTKGAELLTSIRRYGQNVNINGVYQSVLAARAAFWFLHADGKLGVSFADRPHGMVQDDWDALLAFADKYLLGKAVDRDFYTFPQNCSNLRRRSPLHSQKEPTHLQGAGLACNRILLFFCCRGFA
jgi:hypothetical protein